MIPVYKKLLSVISLVLLCLLCSVSQLKAETKTLRTAQLLDKGHPSELGLIRFGELLKERTNGDITIELKDNTIFFGERDLIEGIQMGELDLIVITTAPLYGFATDFLIFDLPYIFPNEEIARKVLDGPIGEKKLKNAQHVGLMGLTYYENGMRNISSKNIPIHLPKDIQGLKIRTLESRIHMATFRAMGATPVPLPYHDILKYVQKGNIDAQENPISVMMTGELYKFQKYYTLTEHFYLAAPMFISLATWNKLSKEEQTIIVECAKESTKYQRQLSSEMNSPEVLNNMSKYMETIELTDKDAWIKATEHVKNAFMPEIGEESYNELKNEIERIQAEN
jgi:tripartite ATP-independent transporter DctP family solute receptor